MAKKKQNKKDESEKEMVEFRAEIDEILPTTDLTKLEWKRVHPTQQTERKERKEHTGVYENENIFIRAILERFEHEVYRVDAKGGFDDLAEDFALLASKEKRLQGKFKHKFFDDFANMYSFFRRVDIVDMEDVAGARVYKIRADFDGEIYLLRIAIRKM